jgi:2,4-dienoyl-CoA reductase-like NADH-dependent reductase (Old Yellow Enzyme family)
LRIREAIFRNRCIIAPMQMYAADDDGLANDWHFQHLAKFAVGGAGGILTEGLAVEPVGRNTHKDLGIWSDHHIAPLRRITRFLREAGALAGAQLHHGGPRASRQLPWNGLGPLNSDDEAQGETPWLPVGPSAVPYGKGWPVPHELTRCEIQSVIGAFGSAAARCEAAGFDFIEIHAGHDYLIHSFLSPRYNYRNDAYGGDLAGRMRLALELAEHLRCRWPSAKPIFFRLSCVDRQSAGWTLDETVTLVRELHERGVDLIDCSSSGSNDPGGRGDRAVRREPRRKGFQVQYASHVKQETGVSTMAVGLIVDAHQAEQIVAQGDADLIAIGRQALFDPHWALHASRSCGADPDWEMWPAAYGWWLKARETDGMAD